MSEVIVLGCGYVGTQVARQCLERSEAVTGVVRSAAGCARLEAAGIPCMRLDLATEEAPSGAFEGARLFHLAPPVDHGVEDSHTRRLVASFERAGSPRRILYISTTGVYGDCGGAWVDETWPTQPTAERSRRRLDAEETLRRWSRESGGELVILRVSGIYGPGRLPLARLKQGAPMVLAEEAPYSNRIHVDDLVAICIAAMDRAADGAVFNVSDGSPSTMTHYFMQIADATGLPRPPLIPMSEAGEQLSVGMMSYMRESRRLASRKVRDELGVELKYPSLAEGLKASL
ncbi:SDR family oxidoreductase [Thiorhodococcus mannitoliphagus]|uniref:SDR family oxidoreductase n=1 Tax=Thiorhodococcus mannitoliphagus TaxID=329406 RepID=A0A6P1E1Y8_9GAMM|nr:SDR family oxidoreductase [Thiorhodococcus mannitoliphagus]NEX22014.1 SDR family oxidoreductase [Thiorhodococcus mannitoliphagus]